MSAQHNYNTVCFGEILWDVLPSGAKPGGAPMNVAFHLKKLGQNPATITRIGLDDRGNTLKNLLEGQGLTTEYLQEDPIYPTGVVQATPDEKGNMHYEIVQPVAWDFIEFEPKQEALLVQADYFIFGSLAARSKTSHDTLFSLLELAKCKVLDINLRPPYFDKGIVTELFQKADILKLNDEELELVTGWFAPYKTMSDRIDQLQDRFHIPTIVVTRGAEGAVLRTGGKTYQHPGIPVTVGDTVGSGDSFLAAFLTKTIEGVKPLEALNFASSIGAMVASKVGGWPEYTAADIDELYMANQTANLI